MRDTEKTKEPLMDEVHELRQRVVELERPQKPRRQTKKGPQEYPEELYRSLFEASADAILVTDMKGTVTLANPAIAKMSGLSPDDYLGKHFTKVPTLQAKEIPKYIKAFSYLARGKVAPPFETTFRHKDGTLRVAEIYPALIKSGRKKIGSQVIVRDVTERKQHEENLRKAAQEWRTTFDSISDLVSVHDRDFKIVRVNKALADFFKTKPQKLLGKPCYELFHGTKEPIPNCPHVNAMKTKKPATEEFFDNHLGIYVEVSTSPVFDEQGTLVASTHIVKDVTERKQLEKDVIDQGEFFRIVFNSSSDAIAIIGVDDFTIVEANEAFLHQYDVENDGLIGKTCYEVTHHQSFPCTAPGDTCPLKDTIRTGMSSVAGHAHHAEHGNVIHVEIITSPIKDENGKITQVVHASRDITERKHIEHNMGERIKELTCLYGINQLVAKTGTAIDEITPEVVELIPLGWQYPEITCANIHINDKEYKTNNFTATKWKQSADIVVKGSKQGSVDVYYLEDKPKIDEGPFLKEERNLINGIAGVLGEMVERQEADVALRESEERNRLLLDSAGEAIYGLDVKGNCTFANTTCLKILGYEKEADVLGKNMHDLIHYRRLDGTPYPNEECKIYQAFRKGEGVHVDDELLWRADGSGFPAEYWSHPMFKEGSVIGAVMVFTDITERKQAEKVLQESEERYRAVIQDAHDMIQSVRSDGSLVFVNQSWLHTMGYSESDLPSLNIFDVIHPESIAHCQQVFAKVMGGESMQGISASFMAKDGSKVLVEGNAAPRYVGNQIVATQGIFRDVTERKQAELAVRESEEKLRLMFESVSEGITISDLEGKVIQTNEAVARIHGFDSKEELIGRSAFELIAETDHTRAMDNMRKTLETGTSGAVEYTLLRRDGSTFPGRLNAALMKDVSGIPIGFVAITEDISEQKRAEEERIALEQKAQVVSRLASVGEMAAGIAHEINNPLTGVIGFAHLLLQRDIPEDMRNEVNIIGDSAQRVADIVQRLLTFAHPQVGRRESIDIKQLIETTLALRAYELETNNITVTTVSDPELPWTMADGGQLQQVFLNLIINAETEMNLAHGKGKLLIKAETVGNTIRVSFQDDGPGIAQEKMLKLFDPFFTTREIGQGTGLGLSVCHGIIREHNGQIYAESTLGKGATFVVEIPIVVEEKQLGLVKPAVEEPKDVTKARILVVDDEPVVRAFLTKLLIGKGHEVDSIDNASDALTKIKRARYSVILLDIKMPGMSGIDLYQRAQKIAKSLARRIIFITGDVMGIDTRNFLSRTGAHYVSKPINAEDLIITINKVLG